MVYVAQGAWFWGLGDFLLKRAAFTGRTCLPDA